MKAAEESPSLKEPLLIHDLLPQEDQGSAREEVYQQPQEQQLQEGHRLGSTKQAGSLENIAIDGELRPAYHEGCSGCALARKKSSAKHPPRKELFFVAVLVLCNALPISSLFPFLYFMVRDFGIAKSDTAIGSYAGYIGSALMLGRFFTSTPWCMFSDKYGRKPVMLIGTSSIVLFNTVFGFSPNFWVALLSRFFLGVTNSTLGVVRAYASEICTEEHQAQGLSLVGTMWGLGLIIGPAIGGYLAQPSSKYPWLVPSGSLFDQFPYALPCLCISFFSVVGVIICFWLPESVHNHVILEPLNRKEPDHGETNKSSNSMEPKDPVVDTIKDNGRVTKAPLWKNRGLVSTISVYCIWGLHDMAYSEIFSLWAVSPVVYGGLGLTTAQVGNVLAVSGGALLLFQIFAFALLAKRFGPILLARIPSVLSVPLILSFPLIVGLNGLGLWSVLISAVVVKNLLSACIVTGSFLMINNSVPTYQRGVANGISMTFMSLFKAVGPASAGALFSWAETRIDSSFLPGMWTVFTVLTVPAVITFFSTFEPILPSSVNKPMTESTSEQAASAETQEA